jgi:hypothetical protein
VLGEILFGLGSVTGLGFHDGVPNIAPRLVFVEAGLSAVVGDGVDEGGRQVQQLDDTHLLPLLTWCEVDDDVMCTFDDIDRPVATGKLIAGVLDVSKQSALRRLEEFGKGGELNGGKSVREPSYGGQWTIRNSTKFK